MSEDVSFQIFKSGYEDKQVIAGNSRPFVEKHLGTLLQRAGFSASEIYVFNDLKARLEVARDSMLAHADGEAFEFREIPAGFQFKLHISAIQDIDFELMATFVERLEGAITLYLRQPAA